MPDEKKDWRPKIAGFLCNWCSYAGADLAGTSRIQYPPTVSVVRVPCSGRVNPLFVVRCLSRGVDGVLVSGCHINDCHYSEGNFYARRRFGVLRELFGFLGVDPRRFQMSWVSAAESDKWASVVKHLTEEIEKAGPNLQFRDEEDDRLVILSRSPERSEGASEESLARPNRQFRDGKND